MPETRHPHNQDELLTPGEVARLFGVNPKTVARWAAKGRLQVLWTEGGHRRYRRSEVISLLKRQQSSQGGRWQETRGPDHTPPQRTTDSQRLWALLREHRDQIEAIASQHGASNIRVFGSVSKGSARSQSDIDLVADLEPGRSLFDLGALMGDLQDLLGVEVDVVTAKGVQESPSPYARRILDDAVPL